MRQLLFRGEDIPSVAVTFGSDLLPDRLVGIPFVRTAAARVASQYEVPGRTGVG